MTFNSLAFALFAPAVYLAFRVSAERCRWIVLLVASYLFYASFRAPQLLAALALVSAVSYRGGILLAAATGEKRRATLFWTATALLVGLLALTRYLPTLPSAAAGAPPHREFATIGVSYFVFQAISYLADIYLEIEEPERHPGYHALYLAFFPKLLQGPIERAGALLPQLRAPYRFDYRTVRAGLLLFAWGLFKKVVIADRLAGLVSAAFDDVPSSSGLALLLATYCYAIELYCDFSGYTDMALGSARLFNIRLSANFDRPYLATSVADFWRRWHISFSRWIFSYIFQPLQMRWRDRQRLGVAGALMVTFLVSGLWHGATWCFLTWGGLHGAYLVAGLYTRELQKRVYRKLRLEGTRVLRLLQVVVVFHLVCLAWIFFRARSLGDAWAVLGKIVRFPYAGLSLGTLRGTVGGLGLTQAECGIILSSLLFAAAVSLSRLNADAFEKLFSFRSPLRWAFYLTLSLIVILLAQMEYVPYLYFRF